MSELGRILTEAKIGSMIFRAEMDWTDNWVRS